MNTTPDPSTAVTTPFRFFGSQFSMEDPFPSYEHLRAQGALVQVPLPLKPGQKAWLVTHMDEAVQMLKDHTHFTVESRFGLDDSSQQQARDSRNTIFMGRSMINVDEPDHRRLRGLVSKAFTPRYIASLRPAIQKIADELLDHVQEKGSMDLVHDYGYPLPITVISDMLGVPYHMRDSIRTWSEGLVGSGNSDEQRLQRMQRVQSFSEYIGKLVAEKRQHPGDDLTSQLIQLENEGDRLDEAELLSMLGLLIFAGHETTSNLISIGTLVLLDHPEQLAQLQKDPSLIPAAIEELLRFNGPVAMPAPRFVTEDIEFSGQQLKKGDLVMIALVSADRDEQRFSDPAELEIARTLNHHIAFGQGIHICLGAPLARLEGDIAFTTLLKRMPSLKLAIPRLEVQWRGNVSLRGLKSLPVTF